MGEDESVGSPGSLGDEGWADGRDCCSPGVKVVVDVGSDDVDYGPGDAECAGYAVVGTEDDSG